MVKLYNNPIDNFLSQSSSNNHPVNLKLVKLYTLNWKIIIIIKINRERKNSGKISITTAVIQLNRYDYDINRYDYDISYTHKRKIARNIDTSILQKINQMERTIETRKNLKALRYIQSIDIYTITTTNLHNIRSCNQLWQQSLISKNKNSSKTVTN